MKKNTFLPDSLNKIETQHFILREETLQYLEREIAEGRWANVSPIYLVKNSMWQIGRDTEFMVYNGHHRFLKARKHGLPLAAVIISPVRAYLSNFIPGLIPKEERCLFDPGNIG
ncbi:MAG: hypothetical protein AABX65_03305 [Nanoarchaeota archaeon]